MVTAAPHLYQYETMPKTFQAATKDGPRTIPAAWCGEHLAVHRPIDSSAPSGVSTAPRSWRVSHIGTGYSAGPVLTLAQRDAIALARAWDAAFAGVTAAGDAKLWRWRARWADDIRRAQSGRPIIGPRELTPLEALETAGTYAEVSAAVARAMGHSFASDSEAAEQFPAHETVAADRLRTGADGLEMAWRGQWWPVPTFGEVEAWALDSVSETPDGRTVEPDAPDAWTRLLGVC